jgi:PAS domain S-box-containing protein
MTPEIDKLAAVVNELDPATLTEADIASIMRWGSDQVAFVLVDVETQKIVHATPGAERLFGYVTDEMVGRDLVDLVPEELRANHVDHVKGFSHGMQTRSMGRRDSVLYGRERDGATFPVEISLFPRQFRKRKLVLANVVRLSKEV